MSNDLKEAALKAVQKKKIIVEDVTQTKTNRLYRDYYNLKTNEPISLQAISKRIVKRFLEIEKASVGSILDIFFVHKHWNGFYSRTDSFSAYLKELGLAKSTAYGYINSVKLLNDYFQNKEQLNEDVTDFMDAISTSIESIGVTKFMVISALKSEEEKYSIVDRLLEGEDISASSLVNKSANKQKKKSKVKLSGKDLKVGKEIILTLQTVDEKLIKAVTKTVDRFYS